MNYKTENFVTPENPFIGPQVGGRYTFNVVHDVLVALREVDDANPIETVCVVRTATDDSIDISVYIENTKSILSLRWTGGENPLTLSIDSALTSVPSFQDEFAHDDADLADTLLDWIETYSCSDMDRFNELYSKASGPGPFDHLFND